MANIKRIDIHPMMSQAVSHAGTIYLSGQVAWNSREKDVAEQTREILSRIDNLLGKAGTSKQYLLSASIWLSNIADFDSMNQTWTAWVDQDHPPARATVEAKLAFPDLKVEIQVIAAMPFNMGED